MAIHPSREVAHTASLFFTVRRMMRTKITKGEKLDPSTWLRIETMKFIADSDAPMMKEIADYLSITAPSVTSLVRGLVKSGFVTHVTDARDRRTSRLALTPRGKTELKKTITRNLKVFSRLFTVLSDAEFAAFTNALEHIKKSSENMA